MYKVCFVDDECINHKLLEKLVNWEALGFVIAGTATDGIEGLQLYERVNPDLIFVDIQMPLMDGLEFVRCIREEDSKVKIVLVSAYNDFAYAQKAIRYDVQDFLLKPVSRIVLNQLVEQMKGILDKQKKESGEVKGGVSEQINTLFLQILQELEVRNLEFLHQSDKYTPFFVQVKSYIGIRFFDRTGRRINLEKSQSFLAELSSWMVTNECPVRAAFVKESGFLLIAFGENGCPFWEPLCQKVLQISENDGNTADIWGVKEDADQEVLLHSFLGLCDLENFGFYKAESMTCWDEPGNHFTEEEFRLDNLEPVIEQSLRESDEKPLLGYIEKLLEDAKHLNIYPGILKNAMLDLLVQLKLKLKAYYAQDMFHVLRNIKLEDLRRIQKKTLLEEYTRKVIGDAFVNLRSQIAITSKNQTLVQKSNSYARDHFSSVQFSVTQVADYIGMSKNYFVKVYKESAGIGFWDYVTGLRMDMAKEYLLTTNKTVGDISRMVGYESEYHFSRKFKELIGATPNQFRKNGSY